MSSDTLLKDADGNAYSYDNLTMQHYLQGQEVGLQAGTQWLIERATELFHAGNYDDAKKLRELANEMTKEVAPKLREKVSQHRRDYPPVIESK